MGFMARLLVQTTLPHSRPEVEGVRPPEWLAHRLDCRTSAPRASLRPVSAAADGLGYD